MRTALFSFLVCLCCLSVVGQTKVDEILVLENNLSIVQSRQTEFDKQLRQQSNVLSQNKRDICTLVQYNEQLSESINTLRTICDSLKNELKANQITMNGKIEETNHTLASNQSIVEKRTLWGGGITGILFVIVLGITYYFTKRIKQETTSIDEVSKAQDALHAAHIKMQEESVKLDNKMIELFERQMASAPVSIAKTEIDHSLALKVADEIVRIEMNLSRMDASVKGYKQLTKAVQRIKDNFNANGYEIVDMLGKSYNAGMKVVANFVADEKIPLGSQIITGIIKPQINYNGQMIQAAQITVSQNI